MLLTKPGFYTQNPRRGWVVSVKGYFDINRSHFGGG